MGGVRSVRARAVALAVSFVVSLAAAQAHAARYHVATDGDDSGSGSSAQPWRTLKKAAATFSAGDEIVVHAGRYFEELRIARDGPVLFRSDGGTVTIDARGPLGGWQEASCLGEPCFQAPFTGEGMVLWVDGQRCDVVPWEEARDGCGATPSPRKCLDQVGECWVDTAGNMAWLKLAPGDHPSNHQILAPKERRGIFVQGVDDVTIDGIDVVGSWSHGVVVLGPSDGVVYRNAKVTGTGYRDRDGTGFGGRGVSLQGSGDNGERYVRNALVQNVTASDVGRSGFTFLNGVTDSVFDGCTSHDNKYHNGFDNLSTTHPTAPLNARNVVRNSASYRNAAGIVFQACKDCIIESNEVHDNTGTGILIQTSPGRARFGRDNVIRRNIVYANAGPASEGVLVVDEENLRMYNNTIHGSGTDALAVRGDSSVDVRNNIFAGSGRRSLRVQGEAAEPQRSQIFDHNLYSRGQASALVLWEGGDCTPCIFADMRAFRVRRGQETNGREGNPLFVQVGAHDFSVQPLSPAVDAGVDVGLPFSGSAPDIGAIEHVVTSTAPELLRADPGFDN